MMTKRNLKCKRCYQSAACLMTERMREKCNGPYQSRAEHIKSLKGLLGRKEVISDAEGPEKIAGAGKKTAGRS